MSWGSNPKLLERELLKFIFEKARLSSPDCFLIPLVAQLIVGRDYLSTLYVFYSPDTYGLSRLATMKTRIKEIGKWYDNNVVWIQEWDVCGLRESHMFYKDGRRSLSHSHLPEFMLWSMSNAEAQCHCSNDLQNILLQGCFSLQYHVTDCPVPQRQKNDITKHADEKISLVNLRTFVIAFQTLTFSLKIDIAPEGMETLQTLHTSSSSSSQKQIKGGCGQHISGHFS